MKLGTVQNMFISLCVIYPRHGCGQHYITERLDSVGRCFLHSTSIVRDDIMFHCIQNLFMILREQIHVSSTAACKFSTLQALMLAQLCLRWLCSWQKLARYMYSIISCRSRRITCSKRESYIFMCIKRCVGNSSVQRERSNCLKTCARSLYNYITINYVQTNSCIAQKVDVVIIYH